MFARARASIGAARARRAGRRAGGKTFPVATMIVGLKTLWAAAFGAKVGGKEVWGFFDALKAKKPLSTSLAYAADSFVVELVGWHPNLAEPGPPKGWYSQFQLLENAAWGFGGKMVHRAADALGLNNSLRKAQEWLFGKSARKVVL